MIQVEFSNRSGVEVAADAARDVCRRVLAAEGIDAAEIGVAFVAPDEIAALKRDHLGAFEATDVLAFPIDGTEPLGKASRASSVM